MKYLYCPSHLNIGKTVLGSLLLHNQCSNLNEFGVSTAKHFIKQESKGSLRTVAGLILAG